MDLELESEHAGNIDSTVGDIDSDPNFGDIDPTACDNSDVTDPPNEAFPFTISLIMFDRILSCTKQLSDQLQSSSIDLSLAFDLVVATKSMLTEYRTTKYWIKVYKYATDIAQLHSIDIQQTTTKRKRREPTHLTDSVLVEPMGFRDNLSTSEELKTQLYFPVLDKFLTQLELHFDSKNVVVMNGIAACSPSSRMFLSYPDLKLFPENYNISTNNLQVEVALLSKVIGNKPNINTTVSFRNYLYSSQPAYDSVFKLSQIALTIAVTCAECERSFSTLKRVKTRLRTRMLEERLADLAILSIEKEIVAFLDLDNIVDQFAASDNNRRIVLSSTKTDKQFFQ